MKTKLLLFFITLCGIANAQLPDSLIACYNFSGNANDGTGNGYNGTVINATLTTDRFGNPNSAYSFNGTASNYITLPTTNLDMDQYSYSAWVSLSSLPTTNNRYWVLSIGSAAGDQYVNYNTNSFGHGWGSGGYNSTTPHGFIYNNITASLNQWYHLVVTRSATESKFYVNGVLINSVTVPSNNTPYYGSGTLTAKIGIRFDNTNPFNGKIDDISIYKKALTSAEVNQIYSSSNLHVGLVACYDFSGNANDGTGNGYDGTVTNATPTTDRFGNANSAYSFNGTTSNYITIPTSSLNMNQYSYSAWVYLNSLPTTNNRYWVLSIGSASGDQYLNYNTNSFGQGWGSGGYNSTTPHGFIYDNTTAALNQWYHLVVTRSTTKSKFYVNGVLVDSVSVPINNTPYYGSGTLKAKIGIRFDNTNPFDGKIDDIRIYNHPLADEDVSTLYSTSTGCSGQSELNCNGNVSVYENSVVNYNLKLYPNPFSAQLTLQTDNPLNKATLTVYNCFGQTVKEIKNISGQEVVLFRDNLPSGLYFMWLSQDNKIISTNKFVITD